MKLRSKIAATVVAVIAATTVALGLAAPAEAFQAPPVTPPKLTVPSSVIVGGANGGGGTGAQLAGTIAAEGGKVGTPAFPAVTPAKVVGGVSQVVANYQLGTFIGQAIDGAFGIDATGTVCAGTGSDIIGGSLQTLAGVDCSAWKPPSTYVPNTDAVAGLTTDWLCSGGVAYGPSADCAAVAGSQPFNGGTVYCLAYQTATSSSQPTTWAVTSSGYRTQLANVIGTVAANSSQVCWGVATRYIAGVLQPATSGGYGVFTMFFSGHTGESLAGFSTSSTATIQAPVKDSTANPTRWKVCTITTTDGGSYSDQTANFLETDATWPGDKCPAIPAGKTAGHMTVTLNGGPQVVTLTSEDSSPQYQAAQSAYPNCSNATCSLDLQDPTGSCYDGDTSRCATWIHDPNRDSKYKCKYGSYDAPIAECFALGNAFDPVKVAAGNGMADPATGNDTGTQTTVKPSTSAGASADPATGAERPDCWPSGWAAFNPLNWVLQPLQCAFSPRQSAIVKNETQVSTAWKNSSVGVLGTAVGGFFITPPGGGCQGITIDTSWLGTGGYIQGAPTSVHMLAACPGDYFEHIAPIVNGLLTAGIAVMALLALGRLLGRFAGYTGVEGD